jgi:hypothetical protein
MYSRIIHHDEEGFEDEFDYDDDDDDENGFDQDDEDGVGIELKGGEDGPLHSSTNGIV